MFELKVKKLQSPKSGQTLYTCTQALFSHAGSHIICNKQLQYHCIVDEVVLKN